MDLNDISDYQANLNQTFIDLVYEYCDSNSKNYDIDAKELLKYLWNNNIKVSLRE